MYDPGCTVTEMNHRFHLDKPGFEDRLQDADIFCKLPSGWLAASGIKTKLQLYQNIRLFEV
jgi:hypothetical protein